MKSSIEDVLDRVTNKLQPEGWTQSEINGIEENKKVLHTETSISQWTKTNPGHQYNNSNIFFHSNMKQWMKKWNTNLKLCTNNLRTSSHFFLLLKWFCGPCTDFYGSLLCATTHFISISFAFGFCFRFCLFLVKKKKLEK